MGSESCQKSKKWSRALYYFLLKVSSLQALSTWNYLLKKKHLLIRVGCGVGGEGQGGQAGQSRVGVVAVLRVTVVNNKGGCLEASGPGLAPVGPQGQCNEMGTQYRE